jgi:hypothetical protein
VTGARIDGWPSDDELAPYEEVGEVRHAGHTITGGAAVEEAAVVADAGWQSVVRDGNGSDPDSFFQISDDEECDQSHTTDDHGGAGGLDARVLEQLAAVVIPASPRSSSVTPEPASPCVQ